MAWEPPFVHALNQLYMYVMDTYTRQIFQLVMSFPAVSLGLKSCASRMMGWGEAGGFQVSTSGWNSFWA